MDEQPGKRQRLAGSQFLYWTIRRDTRRLVIDIHYRNKDGRRVEYRADVPAQIFRNAENKERAPTRNEARALESRAIEWERGILDNIAKHGSHEAPPAPKRMTFAEVWHEYQDQGMPLRESGRFAKPATVASYTDCIKRYAIGPLGDRPIDEITGADLLALMNRLPKQLSKFRRNNILVATRAVIRFAAETLQVIEDVPRRMPKVMTEKMRREHLKSYRLPTSEEWTRIINAAKPNHRIIFALVGYAGLRPSEAIEVRWSDVDLEHRTIHIRRAFSAGEVGSPKSGVKDVPITNQLLQYLGARGSDKQLIAPDYANVRFDPKYVSKAFKRIVHRLNLPLKLYAGRHMAITTWVRARLPNVSAMAGHSTSRMTDAYTHLDASDVERAARTLDGAGGAS